MVFFILTNHHTSYDRKNQTNSYDFLRITRVHALLLSVSFKPIFVDFTLLIDMLSLLQFSIAIVIVCVCVVCLCVFRFSFCTGDIYVDFSTACV